MKFYHDQGADPNLKVKFNVCIDDVFENIESSSLFRALIEHPKNINEVVKFLLELGANPDSKYKGESMIFCAKQFCYKTVIRLIQEKIEEIEIDRDFRELELVIEMEKEQNASSEISDFQII